MGRPSRFVGGIAAVVSILGFFGITQWSDLVGDDKSEAEAETHNDPPEPPRPLPQPPEPPEPTDPPPEPTDPPLEPTTPEGPISFGITLDLDGGANAVHAVVHSPSGDVELYVDQSQPHDETWIELPCDCNLEYQLETVATFPGELGDVHIAGYGGGEVAVEDGDVASVAVLDWTVDPWQVALVE